jgi:hypothetical protein
MIDHLPPPSVNVTLPYTAHVSMSTIKKKYYFKNNSCNVKWNRLQQTYRLLQKG